MLYRLVSLMSRRSSHRTAKELKLLPEARVAIMHFGDEFSTARE
jgi:hypothetical protein